MERRLAAILVADVVGYSRLMDVDEADTLAVLKARRKDVLDPLVRKHQGRVVKVMGDGVLVEFGSAVNAVQCGAELQAAMAAANAGMPADRKIILRIGVNLGDVMVEGGDLYGDGVNVAARLESLAAPGSVVISQTVFSHVRGKVQFAFDDLGEHSLKNIAEPVRIYRVTPADSETGPESNSVAQSAKPSIAVLPFTNLSANIDQQYLSDGITEDIITELSRYRELLVIARNSSFQYRDKSVDMKRVGRELGAEYLVEGSIRKVGDRLRITAQLIEVGSGAHLWAEHYDRDLKDVFQIQDEVTQTIVATLVGRVAASSAEKSRRKPTHLWAAYDYFLQAMEHTYRYDLESATRLLTRAVQIDPQYARAYAMLGFVTILQFYADYGDETLDKAFGYATQALSIDDNDGSAQAVMGSVQLHFSRWDLAGMHLERAASLNPNSVLFASLRAHWLHRIGRPEEALQTLDTALLRDPLQPPWYWEIRGMALLQLRRYEEMIHAVNRKNPLQSWDHAALAIAHAELGHDAEAGKEAAIVVRLQPNFSVAGWAKTDPFANPEHLERILAGLRKAGLPE
jgi:adenylate cyclase